MYYMCNKTGLLGPCLCSQLYNTIGFFSCCVREKPNPLCWHAQTACLTRGLVKHKQRHNNEKVPGLWRPYYVHVTTYVWGKKRFQCCSVSLKVPGLTSLSLSLFSDCLTVVEWHTPKPTTWIVTDYCSLLKLTFSVILNQKNMYNVNREMFWCLCFTGTVCCKV